MQPIKKLGYIQAGMTIVDAKGTEATITKISGDPADPNFTLVYLNYSPDPFMWDWSKLRDDIYVKEG